MIGGLMLLGGVSAMVLIAWWSLPRDDAADPATGLFALRTWSKRTVGRKHDKDNRRNRRPAPPSATESAPSTTPKAETGAKRDRRPDASTRRRRR